MVLSRCLLLMLLFIPAPAIAAEVELGLPLPEIALPSLTGDATVRLSDFEGKIVYVDFWASWCAPCRQSLPQLQELRERYADDFEVYAINVDEEPADGRDFLEQYPVSYPVLSDPEATLPPLFDVKGMPTSYLVDRDGNLRYVHQGFRNGDIEEIEKVVRQLFAESP